VRRAGCVLETPEGNVESAVEDHLDGIAEALKE
jgi:flagellar biosynthesis/type III secretory pathway protein FliH